MAVELTEWCHRNQSSSTLRKGSCRLVSCGLKECRLSLIPQQKGESFISPTRTIGNMGENPVRALFFWRQDQESYANTDRSKHYQNILDAIRISREKNAPLIGANHKTILCRLFVVSEQMKPMTIRTRIANSTVCNAVLVHVRSSSFSVAQGPYGEYA